MANSPSTKSSPCVPFSAGPATPPQSRASTSAATAPTPATASQEPRAPTPPAKSSATSRNSLQAIHELSRKSVRKKLYQSSSPRGSHVPRGTEIHRRPPEIGGPLRTRPAIPPRRRPYELDEKMGGQISRVRRRSPR